MFSSIKKKINGVFYETHRKKFDLIVIRINKDSHLGNSRPCYNCLNLMKTVGIDKVYYTTGKEDELICENVKDMISIESSSSTIYYDSISKPWVTKIEDLSCASHNFFSKKMENGVSLVDFYFEDLLKKIFPHEIKYKNLIYFIKYNYIYVCPNFSFTINRQKQVIFYNSTNKMILKSFICS